MADAQSFPARKPQFLSPITNVSLPPLDPSIEQTAMKKITSKLALKTLEQIEGNHVNESNHIHNESSNIAAPATSSNTASDNNNFKNDSEITDEQHLEVQSENDTSTGAEDDEKEEEENEVGEEQEEPEEEAEKHHNEDEGEDEEQKIDIEEENNPKPNNSFDSLAKSFNNMEESTEYPNPPIEKDGTCDSHSQTEVASPEITQTTLEAVEPDFKLEYTKDQQIEPDVEDSSSHTLDNTSSSPTASTNEDLANDTDDCSDNQVEVNEEVQEGSDLVDIEVKQQVELQEKLRMEEQEKQNEDIEPKQLEQTSLPSPSKQQSSQEIAKKEEKGGKPAQPPPPVTKGEEAEKKPNPLIIMLGKAWNKFVFNPEGKGRALWDMFVLVFITYNIVVLPIRTGFLYHNIPQWIATDLLADIVLWIDILFNFRTSFSLYGQNITISKRMAINYLKSYFFWDFISNFPLDVIGYAWKYYPWWRLNRLLRLYRLNYYFNAAQILVNGRPVVFELLKTAVFTFLISHFTGCAYMCVALVQPEVHDGFMIGGVDITKKNFARAYMRAFYWGTTTFTGYENTNPITNLEYGLSLTVTCVGLALYVWIIGMVGNILQQFDASEDYFRRRMESIQAFMDYRKLPSKMKKNIRAYYNYIWQTRKSFNEEELLEDLPIHLRTEVALFFNKDIIEKVPFFASLEPQFINSIVLKLKPKVALPQTFIIKKGDIGREMFFISRGAVEVVSEPDEHGNRKVFATLSEGAFFGEVALINNTKRGASIQAKDFCDLFIFTKADFQQALQTFPESVRKQIMDIANQRHASQK